MQIKTIHKITAVGIGDFNPQGYNLPLFKEAMGGKLALNLRSLDIDGGLVIPFMTSEARADISRLITSAVAVNRRANPDFTIRQFTDNLSMVLTVVRIK